MPSWDRWGGVVLACFIGSAIVGVLALKFAPDWFTPDVACRPADRDFENCLQAAKAHADDRRGVTTATLALFAGAISIFGAYVTARTFAANRETAARAHELDQARQITERFTRAIDQLGSASLDVRLGGIYALERIARDSLDDDPQVVEVLTAYVREHAPRPPSPSSEASSDPTDHNKNGPPQLATDVQAAITVLGRRDPLRTPYGAPVNLARTDLSGVTFDGASFKRGNFRQANLQHATVWQVDLQKADLENADLRRADIATADLQGAALKKANFESAVIEDTSFDGSDLTEANFRNVSLVAVDFRNASLHGANFEGAYLAIVELEGARYDETTTWPSADFDASQAQRQSVPGRSSSDEF